MGIFLFCYGLFRAFLEGSARAATIETVGGTGAIKRVFVQLGGGGAVPYLNAHTHTRTHTHTHTHTHPHTHTHTQAHTNSHRQTLTLFYG